MNRPVRQRFQASCLLVVTLLAAAIEGRSLFHCRITGQQSWVCSCRPSMDATARAIPDAQGSAIDPVAPASCCARCARTARTARTAPAARSTAAPPRSSRVAVEATTGCACCDLELVRFEQWLQSFRLHCPSLDAVVVLPTELPARIAVTGERPLLRSVCAARAGPPLFLWFSTYRC